MALQTCSHGAIRPDSSSPRLVHQVAAAPSTACDEEFMPQGLIACFGRSLSRASSGRHLEYYSVSGGGGGGGGGEERSIAQERSARAKLRWKAVAQEIIARRSGGGGGGRRRKPAFSASYDSKSYALNFDDQSAE
ncbi:hypothetical protein GUJ93_ZPchr0013g35499 [Zizania palustris]|uniref:Uncharacterized protein n=1 Tax=Zizania palustris TaxID=103762 RepID=A0A8J5X136_ZIZPA|nr:hypothetical protein GUJ93_ZPchr0013g35499 [Zizania palustris]